MLSRLYLNDFDLNLLLVMGLLLPTDCFVFCFLCWSISASSSSLRIYCWAFASQLCHRCRGTFSPHLFQRSSWSSPLSASFTQSSSSRLTHFSSVSFRAASVWVSRARVLTWAMVRLCLFLFTPLIFFLQELPNLFFEPHFTALQLLWVTRFLLRSTDLLFLGLEALKRDSCS